MNNQIYSLKQIFFESSQNTSLPGQVIKLTTDAQKQEANDLESYVLYPSTIHADQLYYGIYKDNQIVAMTRINLNPLEAWKDDKNYQLIHKLNPEIAISATATRPEYRHMGYATILKQYLQKHYHSIITGTGSKSHHSMASINKKLGFVVVLKRRGNIQYFWKRR